MTYSRDFRWRAVSLHYVYSLPVSFVSILLGPRTRTIFRWYRTFEKTGNVYEEKERAKTARWPNEVYINVRAYISDHPTFYLEELKDHLHESFPELVNVSISTICRALRFDLGMSRKVLTKQARESVPAEIDCYRRKLNAIYTYPEQAVFIDETSKDGRHAFRRYAWSNINTKAIVKLPFSRGKRVSIFAAMDCNCFMEWERS